MRGGMVFGQYLPGNSLVHSLDPRAKLISTVLLGLAVFLADTWIQIAALFLVAAAALFFSKISPVIVLKTWGAIWVFIILLLVLQVLFTPGEVFYQIWFLRVTREGLILGGQAFARLVLIMSLASILTFTTTPVRIAAAMEVVLGPLKKLNFPIHELVMMMTVAIRFLPTLYSEADKIIAAQLSRGAAFSHKGPARIYNLVIPVIVPLFVGVFQHAEELAVAMEVRCYRGGEGRTRLVNLRYTSADFLIIAFSFLITAVFGLI